MGNRFVKKSRFRTSACYELLSMSQNICACDHEALFMSAVKEKKRLYFT